MAESEKDFDLRIRSAERAHDARRKALESTNGQVLSFSNGAMRAPALVAAGGVAAALGFYSANYARLAETPESLSIFNGILFWLFLSLLLTVLAPGIAYFSQTFYTQAMANEEYHWETPFVRDTPKSKRWDVAGHMARWLAIGVIVASIGCLILGGITFLSLVAGPPF